MVTSRPFVYNDFCLLLFLHKDDADVAFEGGHEEMLADLVCQHAVPREVEMARENGHDRAVRSADKIKKFLCIGVWVVEASFAPREVTVFDIIFHTFIAEAGIDK